MRARPGLIVLLSLIATISYAAEVAPATSPNTAESHAVMTGDQLVQILDETVDWYRTLGTQQQAATQPSDLLILYANQQTAEKVMALAFEIARANAELISSEAETARAATDAASAQSLNETQKKLDEQRAAIQAEIDATRRETASAAKDGKSDLQAKIAVLQRELEMVNARKNLLGNMARFASESGGANALKAHIDAIAASIPSTNAATPAASSGAAGQSARGSSGTVALAAGTSLRQFGIWDLSETVLRLSAKADTIEIIDKRTAELEAVFTRIRTPPLERLKILTARGDALAAQADTANGANLRQVRDQYDTLAWLFAQTSAIVTPLSKAEVLLSQYRHNLANWRDATQKQYRDALGALGWRLAVFAGLLAIVFTAGELCKRVVFRYVQDARRRSRFLLLRKIILWILVVGIVASTFATELGSLATFAGLITAGLAVAMQSVLVSVVGYFFLIGKYGIRVGDRVQIGNVTGEVIDLGLVRMHLMELSGQGSLGPTGRVVAFANSIIFQASGGLFKQIPGVNFVWHEITLRLPAGSDLSTVKERLVEAVKNVVNDYREDIVRQSKEIARAMSSSAAGDAEPQVQLHFSADGVEALVRYPVQMQHAAEIDERVSRELLNVVHGSAYAKLQAPA